jgi:predicted aspartyl protease
VTKDAKSASIQRWGFVLLASCGLGALSLSANADAPPCKIDKVAEFKLTMDGTRALLTARVNGKDLKFTIDSSSFYNIMSAASAAKVGLRLKPPPAGLDAKGPDGKPLLSLGVANDFTVDDMHFKNLEFLAGGKEYQGSDGVLGQTLFQNYDVEYDLANHVIRLMRPEKCGDAALAYWVSGRQPFSLVQVNSTSPMAPFVTGIGELNGTAVRILFDTGASASRISLQAAQQAGMKAGLSELPDAGPAKGMGRPTVMTRVAPFQTLKLGDEEILNLHLLVGDTRDGTDVLLGADFFLSHRIYVSNTQRRVYFTYNGGQVFSALR